MTADAPARLRLQSETAGITEDVEHARIPHVAREHRAIGGLIEIPAGLLPRRKRHAIRDAAFRHLDEIRDLAEGGLDAAFESLEFADRRIVLPQERLRRHDFDERVLDIRLHGFHAGSSDLGDEHVAVAIDDETGQQVGFTEDETVKRHVIEPFPERERDLQAMHQQRLARRVVRIAPEDTRADQRAWIDVGVAEKAVAARHHLHVRARLEGREMASSRH